MCHAMCVRLRTGANVSRVFGEAGREGGLEQSLSPMVIRVPLNAHLLQTMMHGGDAVQAKGTTTITRQGTTPQ